jgi:hypothetical protein
MPLQALVGQFPTTAERFYLAYAESVSAVAYLVREKGEEALVRLIRSYADGVTDDEAFQAAVGLDLAGFEKAWLTDLGADVPTQHGPQAAPAGPLPADWTTGAAPAPAGSPAAGGSAAASADPGPAFAAGGDGSPLGQGWFLLVVAAAGLVVGGTIAFARRRRAPREGPPG